MKLIKELLHENDANLFDLDQRIIELVTKDCQPFLQQLDSPIPLYRGMSQNNNITTPKTVRMNRRPSATNRFITNKFDELFAPICGFKPRTQSIFCTGDKSQAMDYGHTHIVFPKGDFKFIWSDKIKDFYTDIIYSARLYINGNAKDMTTDFTDAFIGVIDELYPEQNTLSVIKDVFGEKALSLINISGFNAFIRHIAKEAETLGVQARNILGRYYEVLLTELYPDMYSTTNLSDAVKSGKEIMLHCNEYYAIPAYDFARSTRKSAEQLMFDLISKR